MRETVGVKGSLEAMRSTAEYCPGVVLLALKVTGTLATAPGANVTCRHQQETVIQR